MGEGTLQGLFAMHRYRKKVWKHIIPQMLGTMEILTDKAGEENEKRQKPQEGTGIFKRKGLKAIDTLQDYF